MKTPYIDTQIDILTRRKSENPEYFKNQHILDELLAVKNAVKTYDKRNVSEPKKNETVTLVFEINELDLFACKTKCNSKYKPDYAMVGSSACQNCKHCVNYDESNCLVECSAPDNVEAAKM